MVWDSGWLWLLCGSRQVTALLWALEHHRVFWAPSSFSVLGPTCRLPPPDLRGFPHPWDPLPHSPCPPQASCFPILQRRTLRLWGVHWCAQNYTAGLGQVWGALFGPFTMGESGASGVCLKATQVLDGWWFAFPPYEVCSMVLFSHSTEKGQESYGTSLDLAATSSRTGI